MCVCCLAPARPFCQMYSNLCVHAKVNWKIFIFSFTALCCVFAVFFFIQRLTHLYVYLVTVPFITTSSPFFFSRTTPESFFISICAASTISCALCCAMLLNSILRSCLVGAMILPAMIISRNMIYIVLINRTNPEPELCECSVCISSESRSLKSVSILEASHLRCEGVGAVGAGRKEWSLHTKSSIFFFHYTTKCFRSWMLSSRRLKQHPTRSDRDDRVFSSWALLCTSLFSSSSPSSPSFSHVTHISHLLNSAFCLLFFLSVWRRKIIIKKTCEFPKTHNTIMRAQIDPLSLCV